MTISPRAITLQAITYGLAPSAVAFEIFMPPHRRFKRSSRTLASFPLDRRRQDYGHHAARESIVPVKLASLSSAFLIR